jgi:hypothetical protein
LLNPESLLLCNDTFPTGPPILPPLLCKCSGSGAPAVGRSALAGWGWVEYAPVGGVVKLKVDADDLMPVWYGDWNVDVSGFDLKLALCDWGIPVFWYGSDGVGTGAGSAGGGMLLEPIARRI